MMIISGHLTTAGRHGAVQFTARLLLSGLLFGTTLPTVTTAQDSPVKHSVVAPYSAHIAEASQRFRIPERWIRAVLEVESAGAARAASAAGAMGLMQIMPDTWGDLRVRYQLGTDAFDPRDNILGGTAYLREMYDRFGSPGFLAAYNAGPERYRQHLADRRPLPRETRIYVAKLLPMMGLAAADGPTAEVAPPLDWREAPLFVESSRRSSMADPAQRNRRSNAVPATPPEQDHDPNDAGFDELFAVQTRDERAP
jgi:Transglycosylase SLT domain